MKKIIAFVILVSCVTPAFAFASTFTIGTGSETCFKYTDPVSYTTDISSPEYHVYIGSSDFGKISVSGSGSGTFSWSTIHNDPLGTRPITISGSAVYDGPSLVYTDSRSFVIQDTDCLGGGGGSGTTTTSSASYNGPDLHEWLFVSCVGIFFLSFLVWPSIFAPFKILINRLWS